MIRLQFSSDSGYHKSNRNLPMFLLKKWSRRLLLSPKLKSDSCSGISFSQIFDSRSERKTQNPAGVGSFTPDPWPPMLATTTVLYRVAILANLSPDSGVKRNFWLAKFLTSHHVRIRGGTGSGLPESTPAKFCVFLSDWSRSRKFVKTRTRIRSHFLIVAVTGVCAVIS